MTKPTDNLQEQGSRTAKGQFAKGFTQNPQGRAKGSRNKATLAALELMNGQAEQLTKKAIELALEGDMQALRLCLERLVPVCKEMSLPEIALPTVTNSQDLPRLTQALLEAVTNGEILPTQATTLAQLVGIHGKSIELAELETRLANLEAEIARNVIK